MTHLTLAAWRVEDVSRIRVSGFSLLSCSGVLMNLPKSLMWLELPLLRRELLENAQKKRTYVVRFLLAMVLLLFMLVFYSEEIVRTGNVLRALGRGRILAGVLLIVDLFAIYILLPAMACSAISTEREKHTIRRG